MAEITMSIAPLRDNVQQITLWVDYGTKQAQVLFNVIDPELMPQDFETAILKEAHAVFKALREVDVDKLPIRKIPRDVR